MAEPVTTTPNAGATLYPELAAKEGAPAAEPTVAAKPAEPAPTQPATVETPPAPDPAASTAPAVTGDGEPAKEGDAEPKPEEVKEPTEPTPLTLDSYKDLAVPEGITVDDAVFTSFKELALEAGIKPDLAPKFLDLYANQLKSTVEAYAAAQQEEFTKTTTAWRTEALALPEFQGERAATTTAFLSQLMDEFGSPEAAQVLNATGAGNHPALVKYLLNIGQALIEGEPTGAPGVVVPQQANGRQRGASPGQVLYSTNPRTNQ